MNRVRFRDFSLRRKQTLIMLLVSALSVLLACVAFVGVDALHFREELTDEISTMTRIAGSNCAAALDFNDPKAAADTLGALRAEPPIASACVYNDQGEAFAGYQRNGPVSLAGFPPVQLSAHEFRAGQLRIFQPIVMEGERAGTIYVACDLYEFGDRLRRSAVIALLVLGISLLAALFLAMRLQRVISGPVLELAQAVQTVAQEKNYATRATKQSNDELGQLVDGFNEMLAQIQVRDAALQAARDGLEKRVEERTLELEAIHKQLVEVSRRDGMAEIATNVLHNVGNVLNSVNISTDLIVASVQQSRASSLARVVALLEAHAADLGAFMTVDPRGKHLTAHLAQLSAYLVADQQALVAELDSLRRNVEHIKEIVAMQQNYAVVGGVKEVIDVLQVVEDSLRMNEGALSRHGVEVVREFFPVPPMNLEKHKLLQILVNLVRNAKYACDETERTDHRLTLRVAIVEGRVRIAVSDNGVGIPPENLDRIFNHGFTTRAGGHGFGLHSGALAAREMGGALTVHSAGPEQGATFTLELPYPPAGELP